MIYGTRQQAELEIIYNKRHKPDSEWTIEEVIGTNAYGQNVTRYRVLRDGTSRPSPYIPDGKDYP